MILFKYQPGVHHRTTNPCSECSDSQNDQVFADDQTKRYEDNVNRASCMGLMPFCNGELEIRPRLGDL
jgi:hypothetical protein